MEVFRWGRWEGFFNFLNLLWERWIIALGMEFFNTLILLFLGEGGYIFRSCLHFSGHCVTCGIQWTARYLSLLCTRRLALLESMVTIGIADERNLKESEQN